MKSQGRTLRQWWIVGAWVQLCNSSQMIPPELWKKLNGGRWWPATLTPRQSHFFELSWLCFILFYFHIFFMLNIISWFRKLFSVIKWNDWGTIKTWNYFLKWIFYFKHTFPLFPMEYTKARIFLSCYQMHTNILTSFFLDFVEGNQ